MCPYYYYPFAPEIYWTLRNRKDRQIIFAMIACFTSFERIAQNMAMLRIGTPDRITKACESVVNWQAVTLYDQSIDNIYINGVCTLDITNNYFYDELFT